MLCPLQEINYDSPRGGVSVITEKGELTTSYLLVQRARVSDSGKYTCAPSNANPSTVSVHILSGTYPFRFTDVRFFTPQSCPCPRFHMSFLVCQAIRLSCIWQAKLEMAWESILMRFYKYFSISSDLFFLVQVSIRRPCSTLGS